MGPDSALTQRIILVTGANGALGQAIARAFLDESPANHLWLGVHTRREKADQLAAEFPGRCHIVTLDVTSRTSWQETVQGMAAAHPRLDVLVNNAGKAADNLLANLSPESWEEIIAANLDGVFHGCQAVLPAMISQRRGRIINIASLSALVPPAGQANYAAAKAGVLALTQSLAKEVARMQITINAICPGYIDTEALSGMSAEQRQAAASRIPMRRFGRPEEIAAAVRFLASPDASYITGSLLKIDGGIL